MKPIINTALFIFLLAGSPLWAQNSSFKDAQLKNGRVKQAYATKWEPLAKELKAKSVDPANFDVFIRVFKLEKELELWVKNKSDKSYTFLKKIAVCASSGDLGPKRREGDRQVPEGMYEISVFNPASDYFLAVKVSYPNQSDRILAKGPTGGDIMIHGNCVTIGCIPLQDEPVKDLYLLCVEARNRKSPIRVEIYPCHLKEENLTKLKNAYPEEKVNFWNNLKTAYAYFEAHQQPVKYTIDKKGNYVFKAD
ncbi:MAG: L,D-transpeptidase family protein [Bacteroidia bacterium]